jgi:hypothetical protein
MTAVPAHRTAQYIEGHWYLPVEDYHELREALDMAVYHAENLQRVRDLRVVRDLDKSEAGFRKAKRLLERLR